MIKRTYRLSEEEDTGREFITRTTFDWNDVVRVEESAIEWKTYDQADICVVYFENTSSLYLRESFPKVESEFVKFREKKNQVFKLTGLQ